MKAIPEVIILGVRISFDSLIGLIISGFTSLLDIKAGGATGSFSFSAFGLNNLGVGFSRGPLEILVLSFALYLSI